MNRKRGRIILVLFILIVAGCREEPKEQSRSIGNLPGNIPEQEVWESEIRLSKNGNNQAVIAYGHMVKFESQKTAFFDEGVQVDFFDEFGSHTSTLNAEKGEYNEELNNVRGYGNVVVVSDSGLVLLTERITWDNLKERIISDTSVIFITPENDTLFSKGGFESNADLTDRKFYQTRFVSHESIDLDKFEESFLKKDSVHTDTSRGI